MNDESNASKTRMKNLRESLDRITQTTDCKDNNVSGENFIKAKIIIIEDRTHASPASDISSVQRPTWLR